MTFKFSKDTRVIIFDFDGVILDSVPLKTEGFRILFKDYPVNIVDKLIEFHKANGGMSRYKKIEYFHNNLLGKKVNQKEVQILAEKFSSITLEELKKDSFRIDDAIGFIKGNYKKFDLHIASGADEKDLKILCSAHNLTKYFKSISGSPKVKSDIVGTILKSYDYCKDEVILIGDALNDYDAARDNGITFFGYNNPMLKKYSLNHIDILL